MITNEGLEEEAVAIFEFIYQENFEAWQDFCKNRRKAKGNQSLEHTTMLVRSLTQPQPWRFLLSAKELDIFTELAKGLEEFIGKVRARKGSEA